MRSHARGGGGNLLGAIWACTPLVHSGGLACSVTNVLATFLDALNNCLPPPPGLGSPGYVSVCEGLNRASTRAQEPLWAVLGRGDSIYARVVSSLAPGFSPHNYMY